MVIDWLLQHYVQSKIHVHVGCFVNPMMAGKLQISSAWTNTEKYSTILNLTLSARVCFIHFIHFYTLKMAEVSPCKNIQV